MKVSKVFTLPATLLLATLSTISLPTILYQRAAWAVSSSVHLAGSVARSAPMSPGQRVVVVNLYTLNNLNMGWILMDIGSGRVIANGTITSQNNISRLANTEAGRTYRLYLECQEPVWNDTKCRGGGIVRW